MPQNIATEAALGFLGDRNVGLDGVLAQQATYQKSGFTRAYRNRRYAGRSRGQQPQNADIVPLATVPFETLVAYDRQVFPAPRSSFLRSWIRQPASTALGIMRDGNLAGYGVIRKCRNGYKIGPLMANNGDLADALFLALTADVHPVESIYLDVPEVNQEAVALAASHNMNSVFETARMYTGENPDIPLNHVFGVTSFELG